jgi:hypothetical protein
MHRDKQNRDHRERSVSEFPHLGSVPGTGCGKSDPTGETACPTSLQLLDLSWWGRRFRLPFGAFPEFFRSL